MKELGIITQLPVYHQALKTLYVYASAQKILASFGLQ